jgi:hypothetical protein
MAFLVHLKNIFVHVLDFDRGSPFMFFSLGVARPGTGCRYRYCFHLLETVLNFFGSGKFLKSVGT